MPTLLAVQHVPWETPHRLLDACESLDVRTAMPLEDEPLPAHGDVAGAVFMGGPMGVGEVDRYPALVEERQWIVRALELEMPLLGICLGAQLLASALGAEVGPGEGVELGFKPVEVLDSADPLLGALAPSTTVLHWHGEVFELPDGARSLASSVRTEHQAFRHGNAWGVLFHPEADAVLVDSWLAVPEMAGEAIDVLGPDAVATLRTQAARAAPMLVKRTSPGLRAFAAMVEGATL